MQQSLIGVTDLDWVYWTLAMEIRFYVLIGAIMALELWERVRWFLWIR